MLVKLQISVREIEEGWVQEGHLLKVQHHSSVAVFSSVLSAFLEIVWLLPHGEEPELINLAGTTLAPHRTRGGPDSLAKLPQWFLVEAAQQHTNQNAEHKDRPAKVRSWDT